ncbi:hypothetical protein [Halorhodospira halochloris]|uniref:hypothetical protein n=1 Tax=Halorhodospira halochloris TaxID=1052 RepID=UPI001EE8E18C|nr:hypothetical protein [Halorhodospira halochloris]MCG5548798.1 hypothetical protein [Halorhodospira halochloris]
MNANKAPIWRDAQRLLVLTEEAVRRFPRYHKYTLGSGLRRQGVPHLFVAEEGYLPGGLKRRVLRLAWWPHQTPLPLWGDIQGV